MKQVIWKFQFNGGFGERIVEIPTGAEILNFGLQDGVPTIWARCDVSAPKVRRLFFILPTGQEFELGGEARMSYIGTVSFVQEIVVPPGIIKPGHNGKEQRARQVVVIHAFDAGEERVISNESNDRVASESETANS